MHDCKPAPAGGQPDYGEIIPNEYAADMDYVARRAADRADVRSTAAGADADTSTPPTDRGVEILQAVGIHWLTVSGRGKYNRALLMSLCDEVLGLYEDRDRGGMGYTERRDYLVGATLYTSPDRDDFTLAVQGQGCEVIGAEGVRKLADAFIDTGGKVTRWDVAVDGVPVEPGEVWRLLMCGEIRTRAQRASFRYIQSPDGDADTVTVGSRTSERHLRVYNRRGPTRAELEMKGDYAMRAYQALRQHAGALGDFAKGIIRQYLDAQDALWDFFRTVDCVEPPKQNIAARTAYRAIAWLQRQAAGTLAALREMAPDVLELIIDGGHTKKSYYANLALLTIEGGL